MVPARLGLFLDDNTIYTSSDDPETKIQTGQATAVSAARLVSLIVWYVKFKCWLHLDRRNLCCAS